MCIEQFKVRNNKNLPNSFVCYNALFYFEFLKYTEGAAKISADLFADKHLLSLTRGGSDMCPRWIQKPFISPKNRSSSSSRSLDSTKDNSSPLLLFIKFLLLNKLKMILIMIMIIFCLDSRGALAVRTIRHFYSY